ncbi:organic cation transporter protein [Condylostylus longicornis]|uniref:organic cation transporter protein n=1 Tax=Condylostylus longicornis TaxID=2530218 RepID=UPI00244E219F|nr:organic cation transporter protein [Condylostylus longicornis]
MSNMNNDSKKDNNPDEKSIDDKKVITDIKPTTTTLKDVVIHELERIGKGGWWVWSLFFLCVTPNILNGFHVSSYVFLGHIPEEVHCSVDVLRDANWTTSQIRNITEYKLNTKGCTIWNYDYVKLVEMGYEEAFQYIKTHETQEVSCRSKNGTKFEYDHEMGATIVAEWDLVCEKSVHRTSAQLLVSIGKFLGASSFGVVSDKYGRKTSFSIAAICYMAGSILTTVSPWYALFLIGRLLLGAAASGIFYPAFALLTENISLKHRSWMSIAFSASYPTGMLLLALAAYLVDSWRYLQLSLTIPGFLLILNIFLMRESPRWLLSHNRVADAYKIVFRKKKDLEFNQIEEKPIIEQKKEEKMEGQCMWTRIRGCFKEFGALFGPPRIRRMVLTCYFMWCVTSLCYYVTALNADNLAANRYMYVAITGLVDIPSYILPMILLKFMGRRKAATTMFAIAGISLLLVLAVPQGYEQWLVVFAMSGRFGISGVYSIVTLFTTELFPTEIRNTALGTCSTMSHVGSMIAPYVVDVLGLVGAFIPTTLCGSLVLVAGVLILTLPETGTRKLADNVGEENEELKDSEDA